MANSNFQDLEVWNEGKDLAIQIFNIWQKIDNKGYFSLQDQMQRSALSIPSNIAEGSERKSANEFMRYLYIAKGSTAELRTQLYIFGELELSDSIDVNAIVEKTPVLSRKISRLISAVSNSKPS
ncbi:MAG: four helix bundle protein [Deltaproteobacteria bacterium CG11_big_fil_rev_8_21_14_0_20_49_13]|nr:MAG: four helix bundle protein [Deltaproteobacteria bacterium CG11_big_fil_rev_8_21_14_0_20_49_13]